VTTGTRSLRLRIGDHLHVRFDNLQSGLTSALERYFEAQLAPDLTAASTDLVVTQDDPPSDPAPGLRRRLVLEDPPVTVHRRGTTLLFQMPGASAWCNTRTGRGGLSLRDPRPPITGAFTSRLAAPLLMELAAGRGWLGLHAASVAWRGRGILLPGPGGSGKSTIFRNAAAAGLDLLSDDLTWIRNTPGCFVMWPFARGAPAEPSPPPTVADVPLFAIVTPRIVPRPANTLYRLEPREILHVLLEQSGFLARGASAAARFQTLVELAATPAWRLEVGADQAAVPRLLRQLMTTGPA